MAGKSVFGRIATRILGGFGLVIILLFVASAAGYLGIAKTGSMLNFLTGPAWSTADGAMEGVIETESQMLGVYALIAGEKLDSKDQDVHVAGEAAKEAFDRVRKAELLPPTMLTRLEELQKNYETELNDVLSAFSNKTTANDKWLESAEKFEEILHATANNFKSIEDREIGADESSVVSLYPILTNLRNLEGKWQKLECDVNQDKLTKTSASSLELDQYLTQIASAITTFSKTARSNKSAKELHKSGDEFVASLENVRRDVTKFLDCDMLLKRKKEEFTTASSELLSFVGEMEDIADGKVDSVIAEISPVANFVKQTIVISTGICILGACIVCWFVSRSITKPLQLTINALKDMSTGDGDLTRRLDESIAGELGTLASYFNRFAARVHDAIAEINEQMLRLSRSSDSLEQSAKENSVQTSELHEKSVQMTSSIDEMTISIVEIAKSSERAATKADVTASMASNADNKLASLDSAAGDVGRVVNVIEEIAEQTNLLALNATIEAARAGEAGRGFAVVATEVKELAKQTAMATEDIRKRIDGIQQSAREVVSSIREMTDAIGMVCSESRTIASAVEQQSVTTRNMATHVGDGLKATEAIAGLTSSTESGLRELTEIADSLESLIQQYKINEAPRRRSEDYVGTGA